MPEIHPTRNSERPSGTERLRCWYIYYFRCLCALFYYTYSLFFTKLLTYTFFRVLYDGANGVGAKKVKYLKEALEGSLIVDMYNDEIIGSGKLNYLVKKYINSTNDIQ